MAALDWTRWRTWARPEVWLFLVWALEGRIPRLPFWVAGIALNVAGFAADRLAFGLAGNPGSALVALIFLYPSLALAVKRAHDRGRSELYLVFFFLPVFLVSLLQVLGYADEPGALKPVLLTLGLWVLAAMIVMVVDLGLLPGEKGANRYGADPLA